MSPMRKWRLHGYALGIVCLGLALLCAIGAVRVSSASGAAICGLCAAINAYLFGSVASTLWDTRNAE